MLIIYRDLQDSVWSLWEHVAYFAQHLFSKIATAVSYIFNPSNILASPTVAFVSEQLLDFTAFLRTHHIRNWNMESERTSGTERRP